jgi:hypothetical protein
MLEGFFKKTNDNSQSTQQQGTSSHIPGSNNDPVQYGSHQSNNQNYGSTSHHRESYIQNDPNKPDKLGYMSGYNKPDTSSYMTGSNKLDTSSYMTGSNKPDRSSYMTGSNKQDTSSYISGSNKSVRSGYMNDSLKSDTASTSNNSSQKTDQKSSAVSILIY